MDSAPAKRADAIRAEIWRGGRRSLTIGLILNVVGTAFEALAVATVLPTVVATIGGLELYGWAFSGFMLTSLIGICVAGSAADARGPAPPLLAGGAAFVAGLVIAAFAPSMPILIVGRIVQGLGAGAISAVAYVAVGQVYSAAARPRMLALLSTAWVVPGMVGPAIAGVIADQLGWRWVFLTIVPVCAIGTALAARSLARRQPGEGESSTGCSTPALEAGAADVPRHDARERSLAALVLALGAGVAIAGLEVAARPIAAAMAVAGSAAALPALRRLLPPGTLLLRRGLPAAIAIMGALGFGFFAAEAFVPLSLTDVRGQPAALSGIPLTAGTLAWTAGAWVQARESLRRSRRALIASGIGLIGAGIAITAAVLIATVPLAVATLGWGVAGLGMGIAYSTTAVVILELAPPGRTGEASAALQIAITLGIAVGTGIGGALLSAIVAARGSTAQGIGVAYLATLAALSLGLVAALRLPARGRH
jgi:MFS family permease